jgi:predicted ATPase/DNA-binding XRE family transcriptional regulator
MPKPPVVLPKTSSSYSPATGDFVELLKRCRSRSGYSQEYLAEKGRLSVETVRALERGVRRAPNSGTLELLCDALELSGDERVAFKEAANAARARPVIRERPGSGRSSDLPAQLTPLIGREDDITGLTALLETHRLVTVTGPSGVGKSRVALDVAVSHARRGCRDVYFVDLASLDSSVSVADKIASVVERSDTVVSTLQDLSESLRARRILLLIDNCEHRTSDVSEIALVLLRTCRDIRLLIASSERLAVDGETLFRLQPLTFSERVPASLEEARTYSALTLFIQRAETGAGRCIGVHDLRHVVDICRRLEGNPRAIELAAARLAGMGLRDLHSRLNGRLVLTGGGRDLPMRKRTPLGAIDWSYNALGELEQKLLRRLSVFDVAHTLEDAEAVCADWDLERSPVAHILESLVRKSLVGMTGSGDAARYRLFHFVRSYGLEKLADAGELQLFSERHAQRVANEAR